MAVKDFRDAGLPLPGSCEDWAGDADFIREILDRIGGKWSILILVTLGHGPSRYTELHRHIPGLSQRMLTLTLKHLERDGLIQRTAYAEVPPRVVYALTSLGATLLSAVRALSEWAVAHHGEIRANRERFDAVTSEHHLRLSSQLGKSTGPAADGVSPRRTSVRLG